MLTISILHGQAAIEHWRKHGGALCRYRDSTGPALEGLTIEQAEEIAERDPTLIYLQLREER
jgi:hypothetical protein